MSRSKRSHEGEITIDSRFTPGVPQEIIRAGGLPVGAGMGLFEAPTITCSHCQVVVVINPLRNRDRHWCRKCDHYICDVCSAIMAKTMECKTFKQVIEEMQESALKEVGVIKHV